MICKKHKTKNLSYFSNSGSILIYVLWILIVISVLAFQLSAASRVVVVNQSAISNQLKKQMQIDSAVQFAMFKIIKDEWENRSFELNLNGHKMIIKIYNESGFISLYELSNKSLKSIFEMVNMPQETIDNLAVVMQEEDEELRFNSFDELLQFDGINKEILEQLIPYVTIFHADPINPAYSPPEVLMLQPGIDQYRVQKLAESTDINENVYLRDELTNLLVLLGYDLSEDPSTYYRIHIVIDEMIFRVYSLYDRRQKRLKVVQTISGINQPDVNSNL